jgi:hypothetical protein
MTSLGQDSQAESDLTEQLDAHQAEGAELSLRIPELHHQRHGGGAASRLPTELLDAIFIEIAFAVFAESWAGRGDPVELLWLAHVCSAWRSAAISSRIWYILDLDRLHFATRVLSWSAAWPLRILENSPNAREREWVEEYAAVFTELDPQPHSVTIGTVLKILTQAPHKFRLLSLSSTQQHNLDLPLFAPLLRQIRLQGTLIELANCQSLTDLKLEQISGCTTFHILSLLSSSTLLQRVELSHIEVEEWRIIGRRRSTCQTLQKFR